MITRNEQENDINTEKIQNEQYKDDTIAVMGKKSKQETTKLNKNCDSSIFYTESGFEMDCLSKTESDKKTNTKPKKNKTKGKYFSKQPVKEEDIELGTFGTSFWVGFGFGGGKGSEGSDSTFLALVFGTLLVMLVFTAAFNIIVFNNEELRDFFRGLHFFFVLGIVLVLMAVGLLIGCVEYCRRCPCVGVVITIGTIAQTLLCCYITARYKTEVIFLAFISTSIVVLLCVVIAIFGFDFTTYMIYIFIVAAAISVVTVIIFLVMRLFNIHLTWLAILLLVIGVVVQSVVFIVNLQMILGGRTVQLDENDWPIGAYLLYTSILDIFIKLVQIIGLVDDSY